MIKSFIRRIKNLFKKEVKAIEVDEVNQYRKVRSIDGKIYYLKIKKDG